MFNELVREINDILNSTGRDFAIFDELHIAQAYTEETWKTHENIGTVFVNSGSLEMLPANKGMVGDVTLELLLRVPKGARVEHVVRKPLDTLMATTNGFLMSETVDQTTYRYEMNYNLPTTSGKVETTGFVDKNGDVINFVRYSIVITVVLSTALTMGTDVADDVYFNFGTTDVKLDNVTAFVLAPNVQLDSNTLLTAQRTKSTPLASTWSAKLVLLFDAENTVHKAIFNHIENTPLAPVTVKYRLPNDYNSAQQKTYRSRSVLLHQNNVNFQRGLVATMELNLQETY